MVYDQNYHNCSTLVANALLYHFPNGQKDLSCPAIGQILLTSLHNGGNDRFCARLGILSFDNFKIAFFVYGNRN
jgi:hypothetical protein